MSVTKHVVRSRYNYDRKKNSSESAFRSDMPSMAVQDARDESDINTIVRKFGVTGKIPVLPVSPEFGDFRYDGTFHDAMNSIANTNEQFDAQPSHIRDKFANDPQKMIDYLSDPANIDESIALGLRNPKVIDVVEPSSAPPSGGTDAEGEA